MLLAILVSATGLLLEGIAESIAQLCGGRMWLGSLITGGGVLLLGAAALAIGLWSWQKSAFEATREKYAARKRRERAKFGRSVDPASDPVHQTSSTLPTKRNRTMPVHSVLTFLTHDSMPNFDDVLGGVLRGIK